VGSAEDAGDGFEEGGGNGVPLLIDGFMTRIITIIRAVLPSGDDV